MSRSGSPGGTSIAPNSGIYERPPVEHVGFFRGQVRGAVLAALTSGFLFLQLGFIILLTVRLKGPRRTASALGLFCLTYALDAAFIGGMVFRKRLALTGPSPGPTPKQICHSARSAIAGSISDVLRAGR
jgi:hypothetical protein